MSVTANRNPSPRWELALLLATFSMVGSFSIDTFFPSLHAIAVQFELSQWAVQQTLTVYMVPFSIISLVPGPLSDSLGRRRVVIGGLMLYTAASAGCTLAPNFGTLLLFRIIQGMSAGVGTIVGSAVIGDLYKGPQAQKLLSLVTMFVAFAPAVAPVIGGWIHVALGWRAVFAFMTLFGTALTAWSYLQLPETHLPERRSRLHVPGLVRTAVRIATHRGFLLFAFARGSNAAVMSCFVGAAPSIVIDHWHLRETQFAWLFVPLIGGSFAGAWISGRLAARVARTVQCTLGFALTLTASALMILLHITLGQLPIPAQQALLLVINAGVQIVRPILVLQVLELFPHTSGTASSVQSCVSIMMTAVVMGFLAPVLGESLVTLSEGAFCAAILSFGLWRSAQHRLLLVYRPS